MKIKMKLLSDVIFGNGMSVPGGEDISIVCDEYGFPYYKGGTFKGVFREELERLLEWTMNDKAARKQKIIDLLGVSGDSNILNEGKLVFSDFQLSENVRKVILQETGGKDADSVLNALSHIRTFTAIEENGIAKEGSLRKCRCVNKGLYFYSEIQCTKDEEALVREVLSMIKWIGSMRNRGFGKIKITVEE